MRKAALMCGVAGWMMAGGAVAAEEKASLGLSLPVLTWSSGEEKAKPEGGDEAKRKVSETETGDLDNSYIAVSFSSVNLYLYPWAGGKSLSLGYSISDQLEAGIDLGINSMKKDKPKEEEDTTLYGFYANVYPKMGGHSFEGGLIYDMWTTKGKTETTDETTGATTTAEVNTESSMMKVYFDYALSLASNVDCNSGIFYKMSSENDKEGKVKSSASGFGINVATLRMSID